MPGPIDPTAVATQSVQDGVQQPSAQTFGGRIAAVTATPAGAIGLTMGHNGAFAAVGSSSVDAPEIPGLAWFVTFIFQGAKQLPFVNQDAHKWFLLPLIALAVCFAVYILVAHGDVFAAGAQALKSAGLVAANAVANYSSTKPMGWFSSAAEVGA